MIKTTITNGYIGFTNSPQRIPVKVKMMFEAPKPLPRIQVELDNNAMKVREFLVRLHDSGIEVHQASLEGYKFALALCDNYLDVPESVRIDVASMLIEKASWLAGMDARTLRKQQEETKYARG